MRFQQYRPLSLYIYIHAAAATDTGAPPLSPPQTSRVIDEDDAARDVAKAMSAVRPLLESYRHRYEELTGLLSKAQASASAATVEARETSQGHLRTFGRLEEGCTSLAQELQTAAAAGEMQVKLPGDGVVMVLRVSRNINIAVLTLLYSSIRFDGEGVSRCMSYSISAAHSSCNERSCDSSRVYYASTLPMLEICVWLHCAGSGVAPPKLHGYRRELYGSSMYTHPSMYHTRCSSTDMIRVNTQVCMCVR